MTPKQEVFDRIRQKLTISDEELNKIYSDVEVEMKKHTKPTEADILSTILSYLTPALRTSAVKHIGIFLGVSDNFGFNKKADTVKFDSIKQYQENAELALSGNIIKLSDKKEIIAIWHYVDGVKVQDWQLGKPITNLDYSATAYILQEKDKKYELKKMELTGDRREKTEDGKIVYSIFEESQNLQGKRVSFMAIDKGSTLNDSKYTKFVIEVEQPKENVFQLLKKYCKDNCLNLVDVLKFFNKNLDKTFKGMLDIPVFIRVTPQDAIVSEVSKSNITSVSDSGYEKQFSCFLPKHLGLPVPNVAGTIFGGKLRFSDDEKNKDRPFSLNVFMFWQPSELKEMIMPESIKKFREVEGNVQQSLEMLEKTSDEEW